MRVVVTGGAGYIGGFAAERLIELGYDVVVFDNLWRGHASAVPEQAEFINVDLTDRDAVRAAVTRAEPDAIMHFAAASLVPESVENPGLYFEVNVVGSHNLITAMLETDCRKLVLSSTAAVYGIPKTTPITETTDTNPINPYGLSKLMVEQMLEWHAKASGLKYAAMRYFNVAGGTAKRGEDHRPETHVIPVLLETVAGKRERFTVFGDDYPTDDGTAVRDYVDVRDLVEAHILALEALDRSSEALGAFNLGTQGGFSVHQVTHAVEMVTDKEVPVELGPRRAGDPPVLIADSSRARRELGWNPTRSTLDQMIGGAWDWMQSHPNGYE
jgi:UDP-glucose 4-epimerase